jgi:hypothetical protein
MHDRTVRYRTGTRTVPYLFRTVPKICHKNILIFYSLPHRTVMRRGYGNFLIFYPENIRTFWQTTRRKVRE